MHNNTLLAYLETALWSSTDHNDEPFDANYSTLDFSDEFFEQAKKDVHLFEERARAALEDVFEELSPDKVGHDLWLTRNGHGAGFWDGDYADDVGEALTKISEAMGEIDLYVGDDGKIYG